ncbi:hypothetical protein [Bordetella sp. N]|uniref:hypothetical protein n=1 Tax=Bordetella sp. N TaxID=1746199 RepID=UPI00070FD364|nr:hypothetical protein [Bordetella sp. N]ALM81831.1 hypothetical protein ASB57_01605 [Bordetella sp. N]
MRASKEQLFGLFASAFAIIAVIGAVRNFSAMPYWDTLGGYLHFFVRVSDGDWSAWWAQHNEHRIVLSRLFFWADLAWFQGTTISLIALNYLLLGLLALMFQRLWHIAGQGRAAYVGLFLIAWMWSWIQNQNLTWAFQSQFFLVQLLPLCAFLALYKASGGPPRWFAIALACGILSLGAMANGVLALPLMLLYTLCTPCSWRRRALLLVATAAGTWLYFRGYVSGSEPITHVLARDPLGYAAYVLLYIGGPFYFFSGKGTFGLWFAGAAGLALIATSAVIALRALRAPQASTLPLALLAFILYLGGSAAGTAGGRLAYGVDHALASRYQTPALCVWAAFAVLLAPTLTALAARRPRALPAGLLVLLLLMLPQQLKALRNQDPWRFEVAVAGLALELGIEDADQIRAMYPRAEEAVQLADAPVRRGLSVFGMAPLKGARKDFDNRPIVAMTGAPATACMATMSAATMAQGDADYVRVEGLVAFATDGYGQPALRRMTLTDAHGVVTGIVLAAPVSWAPASWAPAASATDAAGRQLAEKQLIAFKGYVRTIDLGRSVKLVDPASGCQAPLATLAAAPAPPRRPDPE